MNQNDIVSAAVESECGVRTFSLAEMSLFIATLLSPSVVERARTQPLRANFNGGFGALGGGNGGSSELPVARIRCVGSGLVLGREIVVESTHFLVDVNQFIALPVWWL